MSSTPQSMTEILTAPDPEAERLKKQRNYAVLGTLMGTQPTMSVGEMLAKDAASARDLNAEVAAKAADLQRRAEERAENQAWREQTQADLTGYRNDMLDIQRGREQRLGTQQGGLTAGQQAAQDRFEAAQEATKRAKLDAGVKSYGADLAAVQEFQTAIQQVDASIAPYRESGDIPGVGGLANLPGLLGTVASKAGGGGRVRGAIAAVENALLKARSGGAVTPQEADRLKIELGKMAGASDADFIAAWDAFKARNADVLDAISGQYGSDVVEEYGKRRGARDAATAPSTPTQAGPKPEATKTVNGKRYVKVMGKWYAE